MITKIRNVIENNSEFIILPHKNPDGDTIGSSVALEKLLKNMNKKGYIVLNDDIPLNLHFLNCKTYTLEEFSELKKDIKTVITLDSSDISRFETRAMLLENKNVVNIDHHITNMNYGDINYVLEASSVGEILFNIFTDLNYEIDEEIAEALYVAISTDTGSFKYTNTTADTFFAASKLRDKIDFEKVNTELYQNISYEDVVLSNRVFETLKIYNKKVGIIYLTNEMIDELNLEVINTDGLVEKVRNINEVEVSIFIKEINENLFKASLRSKYDFDVAELAFKYSGGGHKKAAGCAIEGSLDEIIGLFINEIK
ncbi:bifunctional oligoribonuclease/PAP phosphatase NrnA [Clostridiaceae bacterium HSG29]|nr:bifunctional oligoribonuclease/PAP phosphatase NrnA [Clostridiaceae bacterium HSG29]